MYIIIYILYIYLSIYIYTYEMMINPWTPWVFLAPQPSPAPSLWTPRVSEAPGPTTPVPTVRSLRLSDDGSSGLTLW